MTERTALLDTAYAVVVSGFFTGPVIATVAALF